MDQIRVIGVFIILLIIAAAISGVNWNEALYGSQIRTESSQGLQLTLSQDSIDWGVIRPGETVSREIIVQASLSCSVDVWAENYDPPELENYTTFSWGSNREILDPGEDMNLFLNLKASPAIQNITDFNFEIVVSATESG